MKTVIGIDASTTATGIAAFEEKDGEYVYLDHELFKAPEFKFTKKSKDMTKTAYKKVHSSEKRIAMEQRVLYMMGEIEGWLDRYSPDVIIVEDAYGQSDMLTLKALSRIQGMIIDYGRRFNVKVEFKNPSSWRKAVGISLTKADKTELKRPQLKELSKLAVKALYGLDVTDDEADAICIGASISEG